MTKGFTRMSSIECSEMGSVVSVAFLTDAAVFKRASRSFSRSATSGLPSSSGMSPDVEKAMTGFFAEESPESITDLPSLSFTEKKRFVPARWPETSDMSAEKLLPRRTPEPAQRLNRALASSLVISAAVAERANIARNAATRANILFMADFPFPPSQPHGSGRDFGAVGGDGPFKALF